MHYKNGREAKVGDPVIGTTYNRKGTQIGIIVGITPGTDTCNCRVAVIDALPLPGHHYGRAGVVHVEVTSGVPGNVLISPSVDFSACGDLLHAEDVPAKPAA